MVLPIGFFMPLPLAMMIPFMGIQSAVMAKQFGENFQYGKRRISAMSNEEFNKLTPVELLKQNTAEIKAMIPTMKESIINMNDFQQFLVKEFLDMIGDLLTSGIGKILGLSADEVNQTIQDIEHYIHGHGGLAGHETPPTSHVPTSHNISGPAPPTLEVPKDTPKIDEKPPRPKGSWLQINAIGRISRRSTADARLDVHVNQNGHWVSLGKAFTSIEIANTWARLQWPQKTYWLYVVEVVTNKIWYYVLKSKLPLSTHTVPA